MESYYDELKYTKLEPYGNWTHPHKSIIDRILSGFLPLVLPFAQLAEIDLPLQNGSGVDGEGDEGQQLLDKLRSKVINMEGLSGKKAISDWSKNLNDDPIVVCEAKRDGSEKGFFVPRNNKILSEWGILNSEEEATVLGRCELRKNGVHVVVRFPSSLMDESCKIVQSEDGEGEKQCALGCKILDTESFNLKEFLLNNPEVPVIVNFHGGAQIMGNPMDGDVFYSVLAGMTKPEKDAPARSAENLRCISFSVGYSLAPEFPFPNATIDSLSAFNYLISVAHSTSPIHIHGISAGAIHALTLAFEAHRRYPGRIASVRAMSPMIDPCTDTVSFVREIYSARCCPISFLRWGWKAYLQLEDVASVGSQYEAPGSTRAAWEATPFFRNQNMRRIIDPMFNARLLLHVSGAKPSLPKFIIGTNRADALHDEGVAMVNILRGNHVDITWLDDMGSHMVGSDLDRAKQQAYLYDYRDVVFGIGK